MSNFITKQQELFLTITPKITSTVSLLGSAWILVEVWVCSPKRHFCYHKLVSAMAIYSCLLSVGFVFEAKKSTGCSIQGFLLQFGQMGVMIYFSMMGLFYVLAISKSLSEDHLAKYEGFFHSLPAIVSLGTAVSAAVLGLFNESEQSPWCWIAPSCDGHSEFEFLLNQDDDGDCISARAASAYQWGFYLGPAWTSCLVMMCTLAQVFAGIRAQEQKMKKYLLKAEDNLKEYNAYRSATMKDGDDDDAIGEDDDPSPSERSNNGSGTNRSWKRTKRISQNFRRRMTKMTEFWDHLPRTRQVLSQALCYVLAMVIGIILITIDTEWPHRESEGVPFAILALEAIFLPLQGFMIFLAYRRPTYLRLRRKGLTFLECIKQTLQWELSGSDGSGSGSATTNSSGRNHRQRGRHRSGPSIILGDTRRSILRISMFRQDHDSESSGSRKRWSILSPRRSFEHDSHNTLRRSKQEPPNLSMVEEDEDAEEPLAGGSVQSSMKRPSLDYSGKASSSTISTHRSSYLRGSSRELHHAGHAQAIPQDRLGRRRAGIRFHVPELRPADPARYCCVRPK